MPFQEEPQDNIVLYQIAMDMIDLMRNLHVDLIKGCSGNKTAAQRARVSTLTFVKLSRKYRKESMRERNKNKGER